jgi:hypothetical protein
VTATKTSSGTAPRATDSATRRRAACSSAIALSSVRAWLPSIAAVTRRANASSRGSVERGIGSASEVAVNMPHTAPATLTGAATAATRPNVRASPASRSAV